MKLKQQITLLTALALVVPSVLITAVSIYAINSKAGRDIEEYRADEFTKLKEYLKHITDVAYGIVEVSHKELVTFGGASSDSIKHMMENDCLAELARIRFDNGEGYFWVTDNKLPYPTMVMHAEKANLKGKVLDDEKYNVEKYELRNIYRVRAELCNRNGDAFVEYTMKKPGTEAVANKISYSRLYAPLDWIISTGFYTDQIEAAVQKKRDALAQQLREVVYYILAIAGLIIIGGLIGSRYFSQQLTGAILTIQEKLAQMAQGQQVTAVKIARKDEVGEMTVSLNSLAEGVRTYTSFAKEIGQGNLTQSFTPLSAGDVLGNELLSMRDNLKTAADEKNIRDWANEGLAMLGEVLRRNNNDTKGLAEEVLKEVVRYVKVNQGALFLVSEDASTNQRWLELTATYAYNKKKFIKRRVEFGDGLVGQCVMERATIHLREVPDDYVTITSGLGQALPRTLVIVPLVHNDEVFGVLELASFKLFAAYEITFIQKVADSIASTVAAVQVNERTRKLLANSQQMSEEMKAQEEELRQNQEELQATQEQMFRRQRDLEAENEQLKRQAAVNPQEHAGLESNLVAV
jgi:GAF domain-containing protein